MSKEHRTFGGQMELLPLGIFDATAEKIEWTVGQISTVTSSAWLIQLHIVLFLISSTEHCIHKVAALIGLVKTLNMNV